MTGKEWLALNDPTYVKPAMKAARTREIPYSPEALAAMYGGTGLRRIGGKTVQCVAVGFEGSGEGNGEITPYSTPGKVASVWTDKPVRMRGKRGGRKHRAS